MASFRRRIPSKIGSRNTGFVDLRHQYVVFMRKSYVYGICLAFPNRTNCKRKDLLIFLLIQYRVITLDLHVEYNSISYSILLL